MIPNKIYLAFKDGFVAQAANVPEAILDEYEPVEFVNKKALLEWANKELKRYSEDTQWEFGYSRALRDLIDKLNQL